MSNRKPTVLLVDDRPENLITLEAVFQHSKYDLRKANSGAEALALLDKVDCAVIILDVQMPIMDGFETALKIRSLPKTRHTPIIFLTASLDDNEKLSRGYEAGAVDYLYKPFDPNILRSKVSVLVELFVLKEELLLKNELIKAQGERNANAILDNALDAVISIDEHERVKYWNSQAEKIFGYTNNEALDKKLADLIIPTDFQNAHELGLATFLKTGHGPILGKRVEVPALRKDGHQIHIELAVTPISKGEGHYQFTAFVRDISQRLIEEKRLKEAIEARDNFISICSHELNTPLTSLKLNFQVAQKLMDKEDPEVFGRDASLKRVKLANRQLERMEHLVANMLDVTKVSTGKLNLNYEKFDLSSLIQKVIEGFEEQLRLLSTEIHLELPKSAPIHADEFRVEQVIINLISNAMKYGDKKPIAVSLEILENKALIKIQDKGIGIDAGDIDKIFDKFERAVDPSEVSGLGIGLFLAKEIVEAHGGIISACSTQEEGTCFTVELPIRPL